MKYMFSYESYDRNLSKSDMVDVSHIFHSTISEDDILKFEGDWLSDKILYSIDEYSLKIYVGKECVDDFIKIHSKIKKFIEITESFGYYPHILNNYQRKKRFKYEIEDYTSYLMDFYKHGGNPNPFTILL